jgi:hypothetical protein
VGANVKPTKELSVGFNIKVQAAIEDINFVWYDADTIYVQFKPISVPESPETTTLIKSELENALQGKVSIGEMFWDDNGYEQAVVTDHLLLTELTTLGWDVSDES